MNDWIDELRVCEKTIIVEGPNDKKALEYFGIHDIVTLSKKPLFEIIEDVATKTDKVVILTDYDKKGRELYGKLYKGLQKLGVEIDNCFREFLYIQKLSHIEGLVKFVEG